MKKILILTAVIATIICNNCYAKSPGISVNGNLINLPSDPVIINGTTLVPIRSLCEALSIPKENIIWYENSNSLEIKNDKLFIFMSIDINKALLNGKKAYLNVAPKLINDLTYVPLRFISEAFSATVLWDDKEKSINIIYKN